MVSVWDSVAVWYFVEQEHCSEFVPATMIPLSPAETVIDSHPVVLIAVWVAVHPLTPAISDCPEQSARSKLHHLH